MTQSSTHVRKIDFCATFDTLVRDDIEVPEK